MNEEVTRKYMLRIELEYGVLLNVFQVDEHTTAETADGHTQRITTLSRLETATGQPVSHRGGNVYAVHTPRGDALGTEVS